MSDSVDDLIRRLAVDAGPVRRLLPPLLRAALWLFGIAGVSAAAVVAFADLPLFMNRAENRMLQLELAGTVLTAVAAVIAAFHLSLPDRSDAWALLPLPPLALWIGSSGYACWRQLVAYGPDGWSLGESADCLQMILGASIPLGIALFLVLRRARPIDPERVALIGGLGVAAVAAVLLQFFHPFDVTFMDLTVHIAAVVLVIVGMRTSARFLG
jgi:hypothetical protein